MKSKVFMCCMAILVLAMSSALAQSVKVDVADVTASTELPGYDNLQDDFLIDGSGLTDGEHTSGFGNNSWLSDGIDVGGEDPDPSVTFDLGAVYTIDSFRVWNYNDAWQELTNRGVNGVSVEYGPTAALGATVAGITNFAEATGEDDYTGELFDSFTPFEARYIKFDINSNHGDANAYYGLAEVEFYGPVPPPPPTITPSGTYAIAGLNFTLSADNDAGSNYQWSNSGGGISDFNKGSGGNYTGTNTHALTFNPVEEADIDTYTVTYDDGPSKTTVDVSFDLFVYPAGSTIPVTGLLGLGLLAGACAIGGAAALRRKK